MIADTITRGEALYALAVAPFTLILLVAIAACAAYGWGYKRAESDYLAPWVDRAPGELPERGRP